MSFDYDPNDNGGPSWADTLFEQSYPNADMVLPDPELTSLAPASIVAGTPTEVTITGTGFVDGVTTVIIDSITRETTFVSDTSLTYWAQASSPGTQTVKVRNGGEEYSNGIELTVT
jgi:hypothetical protein